MMVHDTEAATHVQLKYVSTHLLVLLQYGRLLSCTHRLERVCHVYDMYT